MLAFLRDDHAVSNTADFPRFPARGDGYGVLFHGALAGHEGRKLIF